MDHSLQGPKSKETRNKILAQVNIKDSCEKIIYKKFNLYIWLISHYRGYA